MKKIFYFLIIATLFTSCMKSRYITEQYIKNNIEDHEKGEFSSMRLYNIFKGVTTSGSGYLEFTGYRYLDKYKALVIGADRYYKSVKSTPKSPKVDIIIDYIQLTTKEVKALIKNYEEIHAKIKDAKAYKNEEIYHDYTVSEDLFISFRKGYGEPSNVIFIDIWIKGHKYTFKGKKIIKQLKKFIEF